MRFTRINCEMISTFCRKFATSTVSGGFNREYISELSRMVLLAMCEQDWVTQRIYKRCEDATLDCFSSHQLRKNCLVGNL